jgi:hypothetical protein
MARTRCCQNKGARRFIENGELTGLFEDVSMLRVEINDEHTVPNFAMRFQSRHDLRQDRRSERIVEITYQV